MCYSDSHQECAQLAAEISKTRQERPQLRFVVYDHSFAGDRVWYREPGRLAPTSVSHQTSLIFSAGNRIPASFQDASTRSIAGRARSIQSGCNRRALSDTSNSEACSPLE